MEANSNHLLIRDLLYWSFKAESPVQRINEVIHFLIHANEQRALQLYVALESRDDPFMSRSERGSGFKDDQKYDIQVINR